MKKFFTLLTAFTATVCANATEMTYEVIATPNSIVVNPSNEIDTYFCAPLDEYAINTWAGLGISATDADMLFMCAASVYDENLYSGRHTFDNLAEGQYVVVLAEASKVDGEIQATSAVQLVNVTVGNTDEGGEGGESSDPQVELSFDLTNNGESFTLTPSIEDQPYYFWVFSQGEMEELAEMGYDNDFVITYNAAFASEEDVFCGVQTISAADWYISGDYGLYYILAAAVSPAEDGYSVISNVSTLEWDYTGEADNTTGIETLTQSQVKASKALRNGRILLDGRFNLDGTLSVK